MEDYLSTRSTWGVGGLLLHELSHAFHDHGCVDGYSCEEIRQVRRVGRRIDRDIQTGVYCLCCGVMCCVEECYVA